MSGLQALQAGNQARIQGVVSGKFDFKGEDGQQRYGLKVATLGGEVSIFAQTVADLATLPSAGTEVMVEGPIQFSKGKMAFVRETVRLTPVGVKKA